MRAYTDGTNAGVFGSVTPVADVRGGGTASYAGDGTFVLIDDTGVDELAGNAVTEVRFGAGTLTTTISDVNGTSETGTAASRNLTDVGTLEISDMQIVDNGFSGGALTLDRAVITSTATATAAFGTSGNFFGPNGEEVGGVFQLDDRGAGEQLLFGTFVGK